jgi:hypothetical protein
MKATELRVGNLVGRELKEFPDNFFRVEEVARMTSKFTEGIRGFGESQFYHPDDMEGIKLNEEWFKRLGFEYIEQTNGGWEKAILGSFTLLDRKIYVGTYTSQPVMFVHELQNLYYSFTGKELHLK